MKSEKRSNHCFSICDVICILLSKSYEFECTFISITIRFLFTMATSNTTSTPQYNKLNYNLKSDTLFDVFLIYDRQTIIESYPKNWSENNADLLISLHDLIYPSDSDPKDIPPESFYRNFHIISINGTSTLIYGITIELSESILPCLLNLFKSPVDIFEDEKHKKSLTFTFLSKVPYINTLFRLLEIITQIAAGFSSFPDKNMYKQANDTNLSPPVFNFLDQIYHMDCNEFKDFSKFHNLNIHHMLTGTMNNLGRRNFKFCASSFGHPGLEILFSLFTTKDIITIYSAILQDRKMIIYGKNTFLVSSIIMSLVFLISPLKPPLVVPNLPEKGVDMIESPSSYLYGFSGNLSTIPPYVTLVNLNNQQVFSPETVLLPNAEKVAQDLQKLIDTSDSQIPQKPADKKAIYAKMRSQIDICDYELSLNLKYCFGPLTVIQIAKLLHEAVDFVFSISKLKGCLDPIQVTENGQNMIKYQFNKGRFIESYKTEEDSFACAVANGQSFIHYTEQLANEINQASINEINA